jgi:hypothetical protein
LKTIITDRTMNRYENETDIIGCSCTLLEPYKGYTDGEVVWDYGREIVVKLVNGKEVVRSRDEVLVFD